MNKNQIRSIVAKKLAGQGNQVDLGSALPEILNGIVDGLFVEPYSYEDLKAKRDAGELVVGALYRITDYVATTVQPGTRSANHPFDLIVMAVTEKEFDAHAIAVSHEGDHYFDGFKLTAWDILYTMDNDDRYTWALTDRIASEDTQFIRRPLFDATVEDVKFYGYWDLSGERAVWFTEEIKQAGTYALYYKDGDSFATDEDVTIISFEESTGKGVIYYMKDEFGNVRHFDFKGIQILRDTAWCDEDKHAQFVEDVLGGESKDWWLYPFTRIDENGTVQDQSLIGNMGILKNDEGRIVGCVDNTVGMCDAYSIYGIEGLFAIDRNVFVTSFVYDGNFYYGCYGNHFGTDCHDNTFGNNCNFNTFGNNCNFNTFGDDCSSNTFGDDCSSNTFGNYCSHNTFGVRCNDNMFANSCYGNTFRSHCLSNLFGNHCFHNTFGKTCYDNTFGNYCYGNTFGNYCGDNTFGNNADNVRYINVLNGVQDMTITVTTDVEYCQFVGLTTDGQIKVWNPADNV